MSLFKNLFSKKQKVEAKMWREAYWNKTKAKEMLVNLMIPDDKGTLRKVTKVNLSSGIEISVEEVTEEQAHEFIKELCPKWAFE